MRERQVEAEVVERDVRIWALEVDVARNLTMVEAERSLDETGDAGGGFKMAGVRLARADDDAALAVALAPENHADGARFDRIADGRAGAVRFDIVDVGVAEAGAAAGFGQHCRLRFGAGDRDRRGVAVLVHACRANEGVDAIAVFKRLRQAFDDDGAGAFAADVAVGVGVERADAPRRRHHVRFAEIDEDARIQQRIHAARDRHIGLTAPDRAAGEIGGDERGRTGRVDGGAGSLEVEFVRDAVCDDAHRGAGAGMDVFTRAAEALNLRVIRPRYADEDRRVRAVRAFAGDAGVFEGFPYRGQQHALLWVHRFGFCGRDAEELGIELTDAFDEAAPFRRSLAQGAAIFVVERAEAPAVGRDLAHAAAAFAKHLPKRAGPRHAPRQLAPDAHDRQRLKVRAPHSHALTPASPLRRV